MYMKAEGKHSRACPTCGRKLSYTTAKQLVKATAENTSCWPCSRTRREPNGLDRKIMEAYERDLSNREIAAMVGCHHKTVALCLTRYGLTPLLARGVPPERVDDQHSRCRKCGDVQPNDQFPFVRGRADARRLSICRACRAKDAREALGASPESYFNDKHRRMVNGQRGSHKSRQELEYSLPHGYLASLWRWQEGLCFYSGQPMKMCLGNGKDPLGVSIDRVDPARGYVVGNVVLCCARVNTIKHDLSPEELKELIPKWHAAIVERLPLLQREVTGTPDNWPRNANGHRLPSWIVERRQRMAALNIE
jgi:hypothetical protein